MKTINKTQKKCILLFVKYPKKGCVKTRLCTELDQELVAKLYQKFIFDTLTTLHELSIPIIICFSPKKDEKRIIHLLGHQYKYLPQEGRDLGEKMRNAFRWGIDQGYEKVLLIGSDSPDLPKTIFEKAFQAFAYYDVVLGPASDGGYYLSGFTASSFLPEVFEKITWSTPLVFEEFSTRLYNAGKKIYLLPVWNDVDTLHDVKKLIKRNKTTQFQHSQTIQFLTNPKNKILFKTLFDSIDKTE